jgi:hypothetical protein
VTSVKDMSVTEGASKALEILIREGFGEDNFEAYAEGELGIEDVENENFDDYASAWNWAKYETPDEATKDGLTAKRVAEFGGEGEGDQYWVVISLSDGETTRYFRRDGWYASYDGGTLDGDTYEVRPQEKTIVVYDDKV